MGRIIDLEELEQRFQSFDWSKLFYDPMDIFNIDHDEDKAVFAKLESVVHDVQTLCNSSKESELYAIALCEKYWRGNPMEEQIPQRRVLHNDLTVDLQLMEEKFKAINWKDLEYPFQRRDVRTLLQQTEIVASLSPEDAKQMRSLAQKYFTGTCMEKMIPMIGAEPKTKVMNEQNFEYLEKNVKFLGFGDSLAEDLRKAVEANNQTFTLQYATNFNESKFEAELHFKRGDQGDRYFFNSYDAKLINDVGTRQQTFYLDKGKGFTAKEAFNLLEGRAVYKELSNKQNEKYQAWCQLEFGKLDERRNFEMKKYTEKYGYDLSKTLIEFGIAKSGDKERLDKMMKTLEKGNQLTVGVTANGSTRSIFVEANPQFKKLEWYNADRSMMDKQERELAIKELKEQNQGKEMKQGQKEVVSQDGSEQKQNRAQSVSRSR